MERLRTCWMIHGFALLHVATVLLCAWLGVSDTLSLTALTMAMTVLLCLKENLTVEITVVSLLLVNSMGFLLGNLTAQVFISFLPPIVNNALATLVVTELLGWGLYAFSHSFSRASAAAGYERKASWKQKGAFLLLSIVLLFGLRIYLGYTYTGNLAKDSTAIMILLVVSLTAIVFMVVFALQMQQEVSSQRTLRHKAEFSYMALRNQVNPHFLFNSLNVLNAIVQEGKTEEAGEYIQKLASVYRYLMQLEGKPLVPLSEELDFARNYAAMLKLRHAEGLVFRDDVPSPPPSASIVPCTLQLLLENTTKHNATDPSNPLEVRLFISGNKLVVSNRLIPRFTTKPASTGIGLQYIRNQYRDIAGQEIEVKKTAKHFTVSIPLLP